MTNLEPFRIGCFYLGMAVMFVIGLAIQRAAEHADGIAPGAGVGMAPFQQIHTLNDWKDALAQDRAMLFVDCDWNVEVVLAREHFFEFAARSKKIPIYRLCWKDYREPDGGLWNEVEEFWRDNGIDSGGMKNWNGSVRFVWIENGRAIDSLWLDLSQSSDDLMAKTAEVFK